jgi:hypothetical protein
MDFALRNNKKCLFMNMYLIKVSITSYLVRFNFSLEIDIHVWRRQLIYVCMYTNEIVDPNKGRVLSWHERYKIIGGIARDD